MSEVEHCLLFSNLDISLPGKLSAQQHLRLGHKNPSMLLCTTTAVHRQAHTNLRRSFFEMSSRWRYRQHTFPHQG